LKNKTLFISSLVFFIIINTRYFWEEIDQLWGLLLMIVLYISFFIFGIALIFHIFKSFSEKFKSKSRVFLIFVLSSVIGLTLYKPYGLIDFDKLKGEDILFAQREGAINCTETLKLKNGGNFVLRSVCFGIKSTNGKFELKNDTIWFFKTITEKDFYQFGIIKELKNNTQQVNLYYNKKDTIPLNLIVYKNDLK